MDKNRVLETYKKLTIAQIAAIAVSVILLSLSIRRPWLFGTSNLIAVLGLVIVGFMASQYRTHFWTLLVGTFFWAGSNLPLADSMNTFRWIILAAGAFLALAYYGRSADKLHFNHLHLLCLLTAVAAFASALVSVNPLLTLLKALSLTALFIYASIGMRAVWAAQPEPFVEKLCRLAEGLVYLTALCYLSSFELWGNPNSLGMITGVLCWPILLWRFVLANTRREYIRRISALFVCGALLISSFSRSSMMAAFLTSMLLLVCARRYRMMLAGLSLLVAILGNAYLVAPERFSNSADTLLYKKGERGRLLGSRQKPWERSISTFQEHPWLGLGFGAADNSADWKFNVVTVGHQTRERGSSYLTMLESTGILGTVPFALLLLAVLRDVRKVFLWLRFTGRVDQPAVVAAMLVLSCLVNAVFEDWMLAVGYYMAVIFWVLALSLRDWMACPARSPELVTAKRPGSLLVTGTSLARS